MQHISSEPSMHAACSNDITLWLLDTFESFYVTGSYVKFHRVPIIGCHIYEMRTLLELGATFLNFLPLPPQPSFSSTSGKMSKDGVANEKTRGISRSC